MTEGEWWKVVVTLTVPAVVALVAALWANGGAAALRRRAIKQELEIARELPDGDVREALRRYAEDQASYYLYRRLGPEWTRRQRVRSWALAVASLALVYLSMVGMNTLDANTSPRWGYFVVGALVVSLYAFTGMIAYIGEKSSRLTDDQRRERRAKRTARLQAYRQH